MHPYFVEQMAADHRRELRQQAEEHRRARRTQTPTPEPTTTSARRPRRGRFELLPILRRTRIVEAS